MVNIKNLANWVGNFPGLKVARGRGRREGEGGRERGSMVGRRGERRRRERRAGARKKNEKEEVKKRGAGGKEGGKGRERKRRRRGEGKGEWEGTGGKSLTGGTQRRRERSRGLSVPRVFESQRASRKVSLRPFGHWSPDVRKASQKCPRVSKGVQNTLGHSRDTFSRTLPETLGPPRARRTLVGGRREEIQNAIICMSKRDLEGFRIARPHFPGKLWKRLLRGGDYCFGMLP